MAAQSMADESVANSKAIREKMDNISQYKRATGTAASAPPAKAPARKPAKNELAYPKGGSYGVRGGEKRIDTSSMTKALGSFKKGGKVKKTGLYKLHKGETVKKAKGKKGKKVAKNDGMKKLMQSPPMCKYVPKNKGKKKRQYGKR